MVNKSSLSIIPKSFNWSGSFDGASNGATYGYAGIVPKTTGAFYTGMESTTNEWAGPFSLVRGDNSVVTNYTPGQFMEFSVNLSKLGLDPQTLLSNVGCNLPIRRLFVKSRASTSFSAQLKDFVGPLDLFQDFKVRPTADSSTIYCGITGPTSIKVTNPLPGFQYTWTTTDGHIAGSSTGDAIMVDSAGTYIVTEKINSGCPVFAKDTVVINPFNPACRILEASIREFTGGIFNKEVQLKWTVMQNQEINYFEVEFSIDGTYFSKLETIDSRHTGSIIATYNFTNHTELINSGNIYFRLKMVNISGSVSYSNIIHISPDDNAHIRIPNFP